MKGKPSYTKRDTSPFKSSGGPSRIGNNNNSNNNSTNVWQRQHAIASAAKKKLLSKENPFDKFANSKKKHEVLNRKVKGEDRNVGRARDKANDERKKRLLVDYQTSKKSNSFKDNRFGEDDPTMSLEDKMFSRFQKERIRNSKRNSSMYNLNDNDDDDDDDNNNNFKLTHKGRILGKGNDDGFDDNDGFSDNDNEDDHNLNKEVVNTLHFGGFGGLKKKVEEPSHYGPSPVINSSSSGSGGKDNSEYPKSRLDALQEIVMKSKLQKLQKKEAKDEQESERDALDKAFADLVGTSQLDFKPKKRDRDWEPEGGANDDPDAPFAAYDTSLREMAFEAKVRPSDRTKTVEEIALEEKEKLNVLEAERLRRMKKDYKAAAAVAMEETGDRTRRGKRGLKDRLKKALQTDDSNRPKTDDDIDDTFGGNYLDEQADDEENDDSHMGGVDDDDDDDEDDDEGDEDDDEGDEDDNEGDEDDDEDGEDDDDDDDDDDGDDEGDEDDDDDGDDNDSDGEDSDAEIAYDKYDRKQRKLKRLISSLDTTVNEKMPHNINCPTSLEDFDGLIEEFVVSTHDMQALVDRVLKWNSVHLPGQQGIDNRSHMHNFLDILLKHFIRVGDSLGNNISSNSSDNDNNQEVLAQLDFLSSYIFQICQDITEAAQALCSRTLKIMHSQLQKKLRDYVQGIRSMPCWPSTGRLLLLRLYGHIFSVTDYQHSIMQPVTLFLCQCLMQCPVTNARMVASGLLTCSILMNYTRDTNKFIPEILIFVKSVLLCYSSSTNGSISNTCSIHSTFDLKSLSWLQASVSTKHARVNAPSSSSGTSTGGEYKMSWNVLGCNDNDSITGTSILMSTESLLQELVSRYMQLSSASIPELLVPVINILHTIRMKETKSNRPIVERHVALVDTITKQVKVHLDNRQHLQWRIKAIESIETKNPKFQADYTFKKELDVDQNRAKLKQLNKQSKRENKAVMRELRRDSNFLEQQRYAETQAAKASLQAERYKNYNMQSEEQGHINRQGRLGYIKGGGSAIVKKKKL